MSAPPVGATREEEPAYTAGEAGGTFTVVVELPGVLAAREVVVETDARAHGGGGGGDVHLRVPGRFLLQLGVPNGFIADEARVKFRKHTQQLTLAFPGGADVRRAERGQYGAGGECAGADAAEGPNTAPPPPPPAPAAPAPAAPVAHAEEGDSELALLQRCYDGFPVRLQASRERGRFLCAAQDLPAGTLVYRGDAAASVVHDKYVATHCHACYRALDTSRSAKCKCSVCGYAVYCSADCMRAAEEVHDNECAVLHAWTSSGQGPKQSRGLRLFIRLTYACNQSPDLVAQLEQLQSNTDNLPEAERQRLAQMAQTVNRFVIPHARMPQDMMMTLISQAHVNLHGITDLEGHLHGTGLYIGAAMFNHSCAPTCAVSFSNGVIQVHTMERVTAGGELSIGYVELYAAGPERRSSLQAKKFFQCTCRRCTDPELVEKDLPLSAWVCSKCEAPLATDTVKCACKREFDTSPEERQSSLATWQRMHDTAIAMLNQGRVEEAKTLLYSVLKTAEEARLHPHHTVRLEAHRALMDLLAAHDMHEPCTVQARLALACLKAHLPRNHPSLAHVNERLGDAAVARATQLGVLAPGSGLLLTRAWKAFQRAAAVLGRSWGEQHLHVLALNEKMTFARSLASQV